jgi:hypothetical protein
MVFRIEKQTQHKLKPRRKFRKKIGSGCRFAPHLVSRVAYALKNLSRWFERFEKYIVEAIR